MGELPELIPRGSRPVAAIATPEVAPVVSIQGNQASGVDFCNRLPTAVLVGALLAIGLSRVLTDELASERIVGAS